MSTAQHSLSVDGQMKLSELAPCKSCGGPLLSKGVAQWYVLRKSAAMIRVKDANRVLGLTQFFQGSVALAEIFETSKPVMVLGDCEPVLMTEVHVCYNCWVSDKFDSVRMLMGE